MGYDTIDHGLWECQLQCTLRNELQKKLRAAGDSSRQVNKGYIGNVQYGHVKAHF
jgi:hypothetical protein